MPTYDYRCRSCEARFELFQSITAEPGGTCPSCRSTDVERIISGGGGIIFKGSGFYETDYRSKEYSEAAKQESGDGGAVGDAKPDGKGGTAGDGSAAAGDSAAKPAEPANTPTPAPAAGKSGPAGTDGGKPAAGTSEPSR
jgi:putative FmdB family regulatory protein